VTRSIRDQLEDNPERLDLFAVLREFERSNPDKPRIGKAVITSQEIIRLGQDPFVAFPASNISAYRTEHGKAPSIRCKFLGFFGPQGALPLLSTIEAYHWNARNDDSFIKFVDIFAIRFLQLFYRAWADARPISQHDRPDEDRFAAYVGSFIGIGTAAFRDRDQIPDIAKLRYAGLLGSRVKSASRLEQALRGILGIELKIQERRGIWLDFEDSDRTRLGRSGAQLGRNTYLGARVFSINDKAALVIKTTNLEQYRQFLPGGEMFQRVSDMVTFYLGDTIDFDIELTLPAKERPGAVLGQVGQLGWTFWAAPKAKNDKEYGTEATFNLRQTGAG
jgi:type VI secretion system protein ImpH